MDEEGPGGSHSTLHDVRQLRCACGAEVLYARDENGDPAILHALPSCPLFERHFGAEPSNDLAALHDLHAFLAAIRSGPPLVRMAEA